MIYRRLVQGLKQYVEAERVLYEFGGRTQEQLGEFWHVFSDSKYGGRSTAALAPCTGDEGAATFSGRYSTEVDADAAGTGGLQRSGFCGFRSKEVDGQAWDLSDFNALVLRVRGDGRKYIANLRTESWLVGDSGGTMRNHDVYQAFLFARKGEWQDVEIPLSRFLLTWKGRVVEERVEFNRARVTSVGVSLAGGPALQPDGPYRLDVRWIKAAALPGYV